jgi:OOP family OmpA-OmpF porin
MRKDKLTVRVASLAAPLAMALAMAAPAYAEMDTYWAAPPNQSAWVNPYGECWQGVGGEHDLPPCGAKPVHAPVVLRLLFELDKYKLANIRNPEELTKLDDMIGDFKKEGGEHYVTIVGHTDKLGSWEHNVVLSENRAQTVKNYMIDHGFPAADIREVKGVAWEGGDDVGADGQVIDLGPLENNPLRRRAVVTEVK